MSVQYKPPSGWQFPTIEEIAARHKGAIRIGPFGSALKKREYSESGIRVLGIDDVLPNRLVSDKAKYIPESKYRELTQYTVAAGDILVTNMGTVGRTCVVPTNLEPAIISSHLIKVTVDPAIALPPYVSWVLNYCPLVLHQIVLKSRGAIMAGFNTTLLKELRVPLPPVEEQRRIAAILDQAEAARTKGYHALSKLDSLPRSLFLDMFGRPENREWMRGTVRLRCLVRDGDTINYGVVQPGEHVVGGVPLVRVGDFVQDVSLHRLKHIAPEIEAAYKRSRLQGDEILLSCVGHTIGKLALCTPAMKGMNIARAVARLPVDPSRVDRVFLAEYLRTNLVQNFLRSEIRTVAQPTLNIGQIAGIPISLPPLSFQHEFSARVAVIERMKVVQRKSLAKLDALFASLQHRAFRGEL